MNTSVMRYIAGVTLGLAAGLLLGNVLHAKANPDEPKVQQASEVLRAQRFELVDKDGNVQAALANATPPPLPMFAGHEKENITLLTLSSLDKDKSVKGFITLGVSSDGGQMLILGNPADKTTAILMLRPGESPVLQLTGKNGKTRTVQP